MPKKVLMIVGDFVEDYEAGNLTSTPAWPGHPELLRAFLEMLGTKITS